MSNTYFTLLTDVSSPQDLLLTEYEVASQCSERFFVVSRYNVLLLSPDLVIYKSNEHMILYIQYIIITL